MANICILPCSWIAIMITAYASGICFVDCTVCTDTAKAKFVPVVRFCAGDTAEGNPVVLDGFFAKSVDGTTVCKCVAYISTQHTSNLTLTYLNTYHLSPIQNKSYCGSRLLFSQHLHQQRSQSCTIDGSMPIIDYTNIPIDIYLIKEIPDGDTSYCVKLEVDINYQLNLTCHLTGDIKTSTVDRYSTKGISLVDTDSTKVKPPVDTDSTKVTSPVDTDSTNVTSLEDTDSTTPAILRSSVGETDRIRSESTGRLNDVTTTSQQHVDDTDDPIRHMNEGILNIESDRSNLMYVAIGCGTVGGLLLISTVFCLIITARKKKNPETGCEENIDDRDEDLIYNSLYESTDDNATQQTLDMSVNTNQVSCQAEENYSETDLDRKQSTDKKAKTDLEKSNNGGLTTDDSNYSEVQMHQSSSNTKDELSEANTYFGKKDEGLEMTYTKTRDLNSSSTLTHLTSPNGSGCEYAVVEKRGDANGRNDVYAVVDKINNSNT